MIFYVAFISELFEEKNNKQRITQITITISQFIYRVKFMWKVRYLLLHE